MLTITLILGFLFCCALIVFAVIGYGRMSSGMNKQRPPVKKTTKEGL